MIAIRHRQSGEILHHCEGNTLEGADLQGVSLYGADLRRAAASGANFARSSLISADLDGAKLEAARLDGATLYGASLAGATLRRASLRGADLRGADFTKSNLSRADLYGARYDQRTRWPPGFTPEDAGATRADVSVRRSNGEPRPLDRIILVIEDDPDTRELLALGLRVAGHEVACVNDGREGLEYLRQHGPPAVILLDMMMPRMDGWAFRIEQLKEPGLASIPVIVCSAAYDPEPVAGFVGADAFLAKPYDFELVLQTIRQCAR